MNARCPKCRSLGLGTDCADRLIHGKSAVNEDDPFELEVTLTFAVPVNSTLVLDPHEMATHVRETWMNEDANFQNVLIDAVNGDYDLQVKPKFVT